MLKTIQALDKKEREYILADIALEFGRPSIGGHYSFDYFASEAEFENHPVSFLEILGKAWTNPDDLRLHAVREIFQVLKIKADSYSPASKAKVLEYVGKEIRALGLETKRIGDVRKRLGQKAILAPSAYTIKFAQEFHSNCELLGITKKEVLMGLEYPDFSEHYDTKVADRSEAISLYVKRFANRSDPYSLLIDAIRHGDVITVNYAFRAYHADMDVSELTKPTELLRAFTDKFGDEVTVEDETGKLVLCKKLTRAFKLSSPLRRDKRLLSRFSYRPLADGTTEVSIAYGVDVDAYIQYLRKHDHKIRSS